MSVKLVTWNIHGLGSKEKRAKLSSQLDHLDADIVLLQETHLSKMSTDVHLTPQFPHVYLSCFNSKQRGVAIMIKKHVSFIHKDTIKDQEGRFIIIRVTIENRDYCICSVYGPNIDDPVFFHSLFTSLSLHSDAIQIIGGDLNLVCDPEMDRLSRAGIRKWNSTDTLKQYISDFGLCDAWRSQHPSLKEYTFYSNVHQSYSRLDYFFVSRTILKDICKTEIHSINISDHALVSLSLIKRNIQSSVNWRFNTSLLKDQAFISYLKKELEIFLEINDLPEITPCVLWETAKAVIRGKIISYSVNSKKKEKILQTELEKKNKNFGSCLC